MAPTESSSSLDNNLWKKANLAIIKGLSIGEIIVSLHPVSVTTKIVTIVSAI
jgi:hypothetical protein